MVNLEDWQTSTMESKSIFFVFVCSPTHAGADSTYFRTLSDYPDFPTFSKSYPDFSRALPDFNRRYPDFSRIFPDFDYFWVVERLMLTISKPAYLY